MIRKATFEDIVDIMAITRACAKHMIDNEIYQWNAHYPNQKAFEMDLKREELFVFEKESTLIGCIVISSLMDEVYRSVAWLTPDTDNLYIHRLAVHPTFQGQGFAQQLMDFAEDLALNSSKSSIRLDTFSQNLRNQKFYELRGYQRLGNVYFPKQSDHPFYCYELVL